MGLISRIRKRFARKTTTTTTSQPTLSSVPLSTVGGKSVPLPSGGFTPATSPTSGRSFTSTSGKQTPVQKILTPKKIQGPVRPTIDVKTFRRTGVSRRRILKRQFKFDILKERKKSGFFILEKKKREKDLIKRLSKNLTSKQTKLLTDIQRKKGGLEKELKLAGVTATKLGVDTFLALNEIGALLVDPKKRKQVVKTLKEKDVKTIKKDIKKSGKEFGRVLKITPTIALANIAGEILLLKGSGKVLKVTGKLTSKGRTIISPKFRGLKEGKIIVPSVQKGKILTLEIGESVKKLSVPLKEQVKIAGKKVTAVSAQADRLVNLIKTKRVVRKPIPNEEFLSKKTKQLLKRFERGIISKRQLINLDNRIRIETKGSGSLLERSFFADPKGRLRPSRLGVEPKEANLLDILSGDVSFRTNKPQVLVFEDIKVQKFPKDLKTVEDKLKKGKTLTEAEARKLLKFQVKKSGKFKPIGALSKEPEITLAPGEIIKKVKTIAVTLINGRRVPIVRAIVIKAKPETKKLLSKLKKGNIKPKEIKKLRLNLKKETGFKSSISRPAKVRPRVSLKRALVSGVSRIKRKKNKILGFEVRRRKKVRGKPIPRKPIRVTKKQTVIRKTTVTRRPSKKERIGKGGRVPPRPLKPSKVIITKFFKKKKPFKKKLITKKGAYNVFARPLKKPGQKKKPKLIKVNKKPLTKERAKDLGSSVVDTSLSRRFKIKPTGGKPKKGVLKAPIRNFNKTKKKFRNFRIVKGKRVPLKNTFIERKGKPLLDTRGEKRGITLRRRIKMLDNIAKARKSKRSKKTTRKGRRK